ncbi:MAG: ABC transporter ATP-binding protein [Flavobacteriales bacterium]|nr:ABC transporter ATP-binding protein [Flavobacteriales bacterium]
MPAQRIDELRALVAGTDLSLATRRLMDLCDDYEALHELRPAAMQLRAEYNLDREMGAGELSGGSADQLKERARGIVEAIAARATALVEQGHTQTPATVYWSEGVVKRYSSGGHRFQLGPIDLELRTGEITGVVGENGNGKTTLLRQVAGLLNHDEGVIHWPVAPADPYERRGTIAWIPQRSARWYGTLLQNLRFTAAIHGINGAANEDRVQYTLHRLGLTRFANLTWAQLSSGYKLRFELARMVVWRPRILVLDEPIANLDLQAQQLFLQDLKHLATSARDPVSIILSSQQLHEIEAIADRIVFLKNGKPVYSGSTAGFDQDRSSNVYELKGALDRQRLIAALGAANVLALDDTGIVLRLTTPRALGSRELMRALANADIELSYFRDISTSTRKLFHQDT